MITLVLALLHIAPGAMLHGVVRSNEDGTPLVTAMVEAIAADSTRVYDRVYTDSAGAYTFLSLSPGSYQLRVTYPGYDTRELEVFLDGASPIAVDVALRPQPQRLAGVRVFATSRSAADDSAAARLADRDVGSLVLSGDALHHDPALASADVLQSFSARRAAVAREEVPTALHVNGAAASENIVLLDGVPLFNPYHAAGTLSAIDPDVIASATLHAGAPDARFGDATGSTIELETATKDSAALTTEGAYAGRALRGSVSIPLDVPGGSALVSARRSMTAILSDGHDGVPHGANFQDLFARATIPVGVGQLEVFAFHSGDRLDFDAAAELVESRARSDDAAPRAPPSSNEPLSSNALSWMTGTDAVQWRSGGDTRWEVRAWRTRFDAAFAWAGTTQLQSSYEQLGSSADVKWTMRGVQLAAGVDASKLDISYDVGAGTDSDDRSLALSGSPLIVAGMAEARWKLGERWSFALGLRDPIVAPSGKGLEPRVSARYAPNHRLSFGVGYSRLHQYVQSLRNEESLLDVLAGITLPVAAGSDANGKTMPVASADQVETSIDARLTRTLALSAVAYARREGGLALVAPATAAPFALSTFAIGSADSKGMSVLLERTGARVSGELAYSLSSTWRRESSSTYAPDFASTHTISLGVGTRFRRTTTLRAVASYNSGTPASVYGDRLEWMPYTPSSGGGDISGSPQHMIGTLNGTRLPPYFRLDFGIRREWGLSIFGIGARVAGEATLTNVLGRSNTLGLTQSYGGSPQSLLLPARSLEFGFEWRH
jgi:hypothetical protein